MLTICTFLTWLLGSFPRGIFSNLMISYRCVADMIHRSPSQTRQKVSESHGPLRRRTWTNSRPCSRSSRVRCNLISLVYNLNWKQVERIRRRRDSYGNAIHSVQLLYPMITLITLVHIYRQTIYGLYLDFKCCSQKKFKSDASNSKRKYLYNHTNPEHSSQIGRESVHQPSVA
jgi:hypothetical protein